MTNLNLIDCPFCAAAGGELLFEDALCRVVLMTGEEGRAFPGFCRVVWNRHVREMSDLAADDQHHLLKVVLAAEKAVRGTQRPDKMNIASLGNAVPHLHWHIIPRWADDSHFPMPIWAAAQRDVIARKPADKAALSNALNDALKVV